MRVNLEEKLKHLSDRPGVYLMKNARGRVIYVGEGEVAPEPGALVFPVHAGPGPAQGPDGGSDHRFRDHRHGLGDGSLHPRIQPTNKQTPRYNVVLRDDKNYPYLKLTVDEDFPALCVVRKIEKDGALYFGPFVPTAPMWETLKFIDRVFPMRKCRRKGVGQKVERPCLQYGMKRCSGPCGEMITKEDYWKMVEEVRMFLSAG